MFTEEFYSKNWFLLNLWN